MSKSFSLRQLTEGIRDRNLSSDHGRLVSKWTRTGLLRGLNEQKRENMSRLLENQAAQALREANTLGTSAGAAGNIDGFTNIAFPIVRRVFGGLVANELVSIQPMSLPSGLLFYLDYSYGTDIGGDDTKGASGSDGAGPFGTQNTPDGAKSEFATYEKGDSLYGSPNGKSIREGANAVGGQYDLIGTSYTKVHSASVGIRVGTGYLGSFGGSDSFSEDGKLHATGSDGKLLQFDPQITKIIEGTGNGVRANDGHYAAAFIPLAQSGLASVDLTNIK